MIGEIKSWGKSLMLAALFFVIVWHTGYWFAKGVAAGGGLVSITINYSGK